MHFVTMKMTWFKRPEIALCRKFAEIGFTVSWLLRSSVDMWLTCYREALKIVLSLFPRQLILCEYSPGSDVLSLFTSRSSLI